MASLQAALSTGCFYDVSLFEVLGPIRDAGFDRIEVCSSRRHLDYRDSGQVRKAGEEIKKIGLVPVSFHAPFSEGIDITSLNEKIRRSSGEEIMEARKAAELIGAKKLVIHPGPEMKEAPKAEEFLARMRNSADFLERLSFECHRRGMRLLLENMVPDLLFGHDRDLLWILATIRSEEVGICLDTGHANMSGRLYRSVRHFSCYLEMLHVNDNLGAGDAHLPPGEGNIDWNKLTRRLKEAGFAGELVLELAGNTKTSAEEFLEKAARSKAFLLDKFCS